MPTLNLTAVRGPSPEPDEGMDSPDHFFYMDVDSPVNSASESDEESKRGTPLEENVTDRFAGCDLLQRLYAALRKFGVQRNEDENRKPWRSAWHTVLDLIFRLMGISERVMDLLISCLHWLADVGEPLTHEGLPKNVDQLKYWHKRDFPDMSQFVGMQFIVVCCLLFVNRKRKNCCLLFVNRKRKNHDRRTRGREA